MFSKLFLFFFILPFAKLELKNFPHDQNNESKSAYWNNLAKEELEKVKNQEPNVQKAKNVIIFLGDGMGISTLTAGRILEGQLNGKSGEEGSLFFEKFPNSALVKTYNVDRLVPDSAGTATAYLTGVKSNFLVLGVNAAINSKEKDCKKIKENSVDSIMEMARKAGKAIGVVTTTRITHATPGASYCHVADRDWENDAVMPKETQADGCKDIARQLIEDQPGRSFNVIFGGGRKNFLPQSLNGSRTDNLNLIENWKKMKKDQNLTENEYKYVDNYKDLNNLNTDELKYVFGLFNEDHLSYNATLRSNRTEPTLDEMTKVAVKVLSKFENGFVLLVEGGLIDIAHHHNQAVLSLHELVHFDSAIKNAYKLINPKETLVLVTADHSHPFTVNGYPERGTNIFGFSDEKEYDENMKEGNKKFTILLYGNGPGHTSDIRPDPEKQKTDDNNYLNYAAVRTDYTTHGGEDVAVYSQGPWSHLFKTLHEQNYIAHVMAYASCIGDYTNESHCQNNSFMTSGYTIAVSALIIILIACVTFGVYICKKNQYF